MTETRDNKSIQVLFVVLLLIIVGNIFFVGLNFNKTSLSLSEYISVNKKKSEKPITVLTPQVLNNSLFVGTHLMVVKKQDNSFSYVKVLNGKLEKGKFIDEIKVVYLNKDYNFIDVRVEKDIPFNSKTGKTDKVEIFQSLIGFLELPDSTKLLVKFIDASVANGKITGDFRALVLGEKKKLTDMSTLAK